MVEPTAPYRFVPLADVVVPSPVQPRAVLDDPKLAEMLKDAQELRHDKPLPNGVSGWIDVTWEATTPLLIGDPQDEENGRPGPVFPLVLVAQAKAGTTFEKRKEVLREACIPGSSLRGMIRSVFEIVTFSRLSQLNAKFRFGYRDFENETYKTKLVDEPQDLGYLPGGWLERRDEDGKTRWLIYPRKLLPVPMLELMIGAGTAVRTILNNFSENKLENLRATWRKSAALEKYRRLGFVKDHQVAGRKRAVISWRTECALSDAVQVENRQIRKIGPGDSLGPGERRGTLVVSGKAPGTGKFAKKVDYFLIDEPLHPNDPGFEVPEDVMLRFRCIHGRPNAKGDFDPDGTWAELQDTLDPKINPARPLRVPVFYYGKPERLKIDARARHAFSMGLTRLFKLAHAHDVGDLLPPKHRDTTRLDMAEALFGYVRKDAAGKETEAFRSRVAVGFATLTRDSQDRALIEEIAEKAILMTPRPSFAPFYLDGPRLSYSAPDARLAGRKRYPVRTGPAVDALRYDARPRYKSDNTRFDDSKVASRLHFLRTAQADQPLEFESSIRFHNLDSRELGALVWALTFGGREAELCHSIGRAKPYGYGRLRVKQLRLVERPLGKQAEIKEPKPFRDAFKTYMKSAGVDLSSSPEIQMLLELADPRLGDLNAERARDALHPQGDLSWPILADDPSGRLPNHPIPYSDRVESQPKAYGAIRDRYRGTIPRHLRPILPWSDS